MLNWTRVHRHTGDIELDTDTKISAVDFYKIQNTNTKISAVDFTKWILLLHCLLHAVHKINSFQSYNQPVKSMSYPVRITIENEHKMRPGKKYV